MKNFIKKILYYLFPLIIYMILIFIIDPYNILSNKNNLDLYDLKSKISNKINYPLFKLSDFDNNPSDFILLGDSRVAKLKPELLKKSTNKKYSNLAYGGGTLAEIIDTFWFVVNKHEVKEIYIGINFNLYTESNNMNRVEEALKLKNSILLYLFSSYTIKSTLLIIKSLMINDSVNIEKPYLNKAEFWNYQLESSANNFYRDYKYPYKYHSELQKISNYCKNNNIKLVLFSPPTHIDLQNKINEFNLNNEELKFKKDISELGLYLDFDYPNEITENRTNFDDPFHYNDKVINIIINEVFLRNIKYGQINNIIQK